MNSQTTYTVQLENFSGPLDVLLGLIERDKLDICEISLATVTNDYLEYIRNTPLDPHQMNWFLTIASKLILVKSRALLQQEDLEEVDEDIQDLTEQLMALSFFKEASKKFSLNSQNQLVPAPKLLNNTLITYTNIDANSLVQAMNSLGSSETIQKTPFKLKRQSSQAVRAELLKRLTKLQKIELNQIHTISSNPKETVSLFMLILELIKTQKAQLSQAQNTHYIEVYA